MNSPKKGVTHEQIRQAAKDLNLTVSAIAEGTGLSKAYISEFRNETRNLSPSQQAQLRSYLEAQYVAVGMEFPEVEEKSTENLTEGLVGMIQQIKRPAIMLSDDIPKAQADKLTDLIEANRLKLTDILANDFQTGGFLGGDFSESTDDAIRQVFALAGLNYIAILMLQGRNIVRQVSADAKPKTIADWLSGYLAQSPLADLIPAAEPTEPASEEA
jgi:transcriptional regulator with XRE-family HTH domain